MPYVHRSANGEIDSLHRAPSGHAAEFVDSADPHLQRFVSEQAGLDTYARLDAEFVRVLEDLIDVLLLNGNLRVADLPVAAQAKLVFRKDWRERSGGQPMPSGFAASAFVEVIDDSAFGDPGSLRPSAE